MEGKTGITTEQLINQISLLQKALEFYAELDNYNVTDGQNQAMIMLDKGAQAQYALSQINNMNVQAEEMLKMAEDALDQLNEASNDFMSESDLLGQVKDLTEILKKYKNTDGN
jgi:hypothetical protein